jgi:hypothetical protein
MVIIKQIFIKCVAGFISSLLHEWFIAFGDSAITLYSYIAGSNGNIAHQHHRKLEKMRVV